jgi:hypothetical protein
MSCFYCRFYEGLDNPCLKGIHIHTGSESIDCNYYQYNGGLKNGNTE